MTDSKSVVPQGTVGSNPTPSATKKTKGSAGNGWAFCFKAIMSRTDGEVEREGRRAKKMLAVVDMTTIVVF